MGKLTGGDDRIVGIVNIVVSCFSLAGSLAIILSYAKFKELRTFAFRLVLMISIADAFYSIGTIMGDAGEVGSGLCTVQALMVSFFGLSSILWTTSIAFTLHLVARAQIAAVEMMERLYSKYYVLSWGAPLILAILPLTTKSYGDTGGQCWIVREGAGKVWSVITFLVPLWAATLYNTWVVVSVRRSLDGVSGPTLMLQRAKLYPLVWVVGNLFSSINAIYELTDQQSFPLTLLDVSLSSLQGFMNAIVFGFTPAVKTRWVNLFRQVLGREPLPVDDLEAGHGECSINADASMHGAEYAPQIDEKDGAPTPTASSSPASFARDINSSSRLDLDRQDSAGALAVRASAIDEFD